MTTSLIPDFNLLTYDVRVDRKDLMGECTKETTFAILDRFYGAGGNFIDTANLYMNGESEEWLGEWMKSRGVRDELVIATKYSVSLEDAVSRARGTHLLQLWRNQQEESKAFAQGKFGKTRHGLRRYPVCACMGSDSVHSGVDDGPRRCG
jgi:aryl-alcohol dehydrogenase-like predicted oxidoreductase